MQQIIEFIFAFMVFAASFGLLAFCIIGLAEDRL